MCGIVGYVGQRSAQDILLAGLEKLEYRGYDSAGISIQSDGELELRARGRQPLGAEGGGRGAGRRRPDGAVAVLAPPADDRHRPHPLGHARARDRGERPPALRPREPRPRRGQRDRRELHGAQAGAPRRGAGVHLGDRRRGHRPPDRRRSRRVRPGRGHAPHLQPPARPLLASSRWPPRSPACSSAPARSAR